MIGSVMASRLVSPGRGREKSRHVVGALGLTLVFAWLLWPVLSSAVTEWASVDELDFAFLVPPLIAVVLWRRRGALRALVDRGTTAGIVVFGFGLLGYVIALRLEAHSPAALMAGIIVWGGVVYLWGWPLGRALLFPIGLLTCALMLQQTLVAPFAFRLQMFVALAATVVSHMLSLSVTQDGLLLRDRGFAFIVADTCSGMNSLLPLLTLSGVWIYASTTRRIRQSSVVASVLPIVLVTNTVRVVLVLLIADRLGQEAALGFFHGASSLLMFSLALLGLLCVSRMSRC